MRMGQNFRIFRSIKFLGATAIVGVLLLSNSFADSIREEIANMSDEQAVSFLAGEIWRASLSESNVERGKEAAVEIAAIEGHAEILAKRLEDDRSTRDYQRARVKVFKILSRIDSRESVDVLISYLSDNTDAPTEEQIIESTKRNSDTSPVVSNSLLAAEALDAMQLPNAPLDKLPGSYTLDDVKVWKSWSENRPSGNLDPKLNAPRLRQAPAENRPQVESFENDFEPSRDHRSDSDVVWKLAFGALIALALFFAVIMGRNRNSGR